MPLKLPGSVAFSFTFHRAHAPRSRAAASMAAEAPVTPAVSAGEAEAAPVTRP